MKRLIGPFVLLLLLVGILYAIFAYTDIRAPFSLTATSEGVQITTAQMYEEGDTYSISAHYPQFGVPAIDTQIQKALNDAAVEIKGYAANPQDSATTKNSLDGTFNKAYVGPDVISVELVLSQYTGGAHPVTVFSGMSFDRLTGRRLGLDDALRMTGLTLAELSTRASTRLRTTLGDGFQFPEGANTNPENFSSFIISADTVTFIFQQYQVAAYAAGPQEVSFERRR